jgi:uncharacterized membrane protein YgcG
MRKTLTIALAVALFGILAAVVVAQVGDDPSAGSTSATTETNEGTTETTPERTTTVEDNPDRVATDDDVAGTEDISGPCDEAEHMNDPRCSGAAGDDRDNDVRVEDDHGHRDDHGGRRHDDREDNSGPCSFSSGGDDLEDDSSNSDHGSGGDDGGGDDRGGDDGSSSGHGGGSGPG